MTADIYLLNLDRDQARLRQATQQLEAAGLPFTRLAAVEGRSMPLVDLDRLYNRRANALHYHRDLTRGELGCYASHQAAWRRLVESGAERALILEDDVELSPQLGRVLQAAAALPPHWDMIKLVGRTDERALRRWPLPEPARGATLIRYGRVPSLAAAYLLSRAGAAWLLAAHRRCWRPVDVDFRHDVLEGLRLFGVWPYPVRMGPSHQHSSIGVHPRTRGGFAAGWCKVRGQWAYSLACIRHNRAWRASPDPFLLLTLRTPP